MKIIYGVGRRTVRRSRKCVATVGVFDGVHRGHQSVLERVIKEARLMKLESAVVTFSFHPSRVVRRHEKTPHVMSLEHKLRYLAQSGIDRCYVLDFNRSLAAMRSEDFVSQVLIARIGMASLYVGEDFVFGRGGKAGTEDLRRMCGSLNFSLHVVKPLKISGVVVSSTLIRALIRRGELARAQRFLGRPVALMGRVIKGEGRGRLLGFPTANILADEEVLVPDGIYAAWAHCGGSVYPAAAYLGTKPTFHQKTHIRSLEAFLMRGNDNLYGRVIELRFVQKVRDDRCFKSVALLRAQIEKDVRRIAQILS